MTQADAVAAVQQLHNEFVKHANAKDIRKLVDGLYAGNAVLMPPSAAASIQGKKKIRQFWKDLIITGGAVNFTRSIDLVETLGDVVLEIGELGYSRKDSLGNLIQTGRKCVVTYQKAVLGLGPLEAALSTITTPNQADVKIQTWSDGKTVTYDIADGKGGQPHQHLTAAISHQDSVTFHAVDNKYNLTCPTYYGEFQGAYNFGPYRNCTSAGQVVQQGDSYTIVSLSNTTTPAIWYACPVKSAAAMKKLLAAARRRHKTGAGGGSGCCVCIQP